MTPTFLLFVAVVLLAVMAPAVLVAGAAMALFSARRRSVAIGVLGRASASAAVVGAVALAIARHQADWTMLSLGVPFYLACATFTCVAGLQGVLLRYGELLDKLKK